MGLQARIRCPLCRGNQYPMNANEASDYEVRLTQKYAAVSTMSLRAIKAVIDNRKVSNREKTIYRLEYQWRLKGGESPYIQILRKMCTEHKLVIVRQIIVAINPA